MREVRPGDQVLPVPNNSMDIQTGVIMDLERRVADPAAAALIGFIERRRDVGIHRYGTALQAHNGRNVLRDLFEEVVDATLYAGQAVAEGRSDLEAAYEVLLGMAVDLTRAYGPQALAADVPVP